MVGLEVCWLRVSEFWKVDELRIKSVVEDNLGDDETESVGLEEDTG